MKKVDVINTERFEIMLDSGVTVGAVNTPQQRAEGVMLTEDDERRHVQTKRLTVIKEYDHQESPAPAGGQGDDSDDDASGDAASGSQERGEQR